MATTKPMPDAAELANRMLAEVTSAKQHLERAFALADELYNAATGDAPPRDKRVQRLEYALSEDVKTWKASWAKDAEAVEELGRMEDEARDIVDLVALATSPREAVAS